MQNKITIDELARRVQAFLFTEGGEMTRKKLLSLLGCSESELNAAIDHLALALEPSGLGLVVSDTEIALTVSKSESPAIEEALKRELSREIGEAGLEVLAIVLYLGPSTRARVDYIRGVNTASTLRTLLARGLIERAGNPEDAREYLYRPTVETLAHLGVAQARELPDHDTIARELAMFESTHLTADEDTQKTPSEDHGHRTD